MALPKLVLIITSLIPLILLILSFAFTLKATLTKDWVVRHSYFSNGFRAPVDQGAIHRSIFTSCQAKNPVDSTTSWIEDCTRYRKPGASCFDGPDGTDFFSLCQQIKVSGQLLIVANLFIALAAVSTGILCVATVLYRPSPTPAAAANAVTTDHEHHSSDKHSSLHHRKHHHHDTNADDPAATQPPATPAKPTLASKLFKYITIPARIFAVVGAFSVFLAAMIGGNALLNVQPPNGQFSSGTQTTGSFSSPDTNWKVDKGYGFVTAAWIVGAFGYWAMDVVWGTPGHGLVYW